MSQQTLSHYQLMERLGAGGMGEVFRARDTSLERTVAIKLLPASAFADQDRVRRFVQEARAASALNHPNILTIHEIGESEGRHYIAMEFVDGESLRERISRGRLELNKLLDAAIQVSEGLSAAHAAGIVHRDVKPENIMVRRDGYAKILDFGLAKLTEPQSGGQPIFYEERDPGTRPSRESGGLSGGALSQALTQPGIVVGTVGYMSPEQVRGEQVDSRSDLFALGCVLYEAAAGTKPFEAPSGIEVMHRIIKEQPRPLREFNPNLPSELHRIVRKAMAKDREARYQSAKEMAIDLRELRREIESGSGESGIGPAAGAAPPTAAPAARQRGWSTGLVAAVFLALAMVSVGIYQLAIRLPRAGTSALKVTRLTATGTAVWPTISSDGKYVAYLQGQGGEKAIWVKQVATGSTVKLVDAGSSVLEDLRFTPDSNWLLYTSRPEGSTMRLLWQVPTLGGPPRKVLDDVDSAATYSPDGKSFAFVRQRYMEESLILAAAANASGPPRQLSATTKGVFYHLRWSPDGSQMAFFFMSKANPLIYRLGVMPASGGDMRMVGKTEWASITGLEWTADSRGLLVCGSQDFLGIVQLWNVPVGSGEARPITNDLDSHIGLGVTANGRALVTAMNSRKSSIYRVNLAAGSPEEIGSKAVPLTQGTALILWPSLSPDGRRMAYASNAGSGMDIWIADIDGKNPQQLTSDPAFDSFPQWSPDGQSIAFTSNKTGRLQVWVMTLAGGNTRALTQGGLGLRPAWSPDSRWLAYISVDSGLPSLYKVPAEGGDPIPIRKGYGNSPEWSPDGKSILALVRTEITPADAPQWALLDAGSGEISRAWEAISGEYGRWMPDGKAFTYSGSGPLASITRQALEGGKPQTLVAFEKGRQLVGYDWFREGHALVCVLATATNDVVLIENFR